MVHEMVWYPHFGVYKNHCIEIMFYTGKIPCVRIHISTGINKIYYLKHRSSTKPQNKWTGCIMMYYIENNNTKKITRSLLKT